MIHGIYANQPSFHTVEFTTGVNVILAERTALSTAKDTRNGLGKSTLIDIIDFCLGSSVTKGEGLCIEPLNEWAFTIDITLGGNRVQVTRAINSVNRFVVQGSTLGWIEQPDPVEVTGERIFNLERWKALLGWALFGIPRTDGKFKYKPTYRSLISFFVRRGMDAYTDPFRHFRQQAPWDTQINIGFLLGLNWEYASKWQDLKDREKNVKIIQDAIKSGAIEGMLGSLGELEAQRIQLEEEVKREDISLSTFRVYPQYEAVQREANQITTTIHELMNQNVIERHRITRYMEAVADEKPPTEKALEALYAETGVVFPESVRRTLAEAKAFHAQIISNRKTFLSSEIARIESQLQQREAKIKELTEERIASLEILRTHGALEELTKLQERHVELREQLERVTLRISEMKDFARKIKELKIEKLELMRTGDQDHEERRGTWSLPVRLFNENSQALYHSPGHLAINVTKTGYQFAVDIDRGGSEGIEKMKVFCFDIMLLNLSVANKRGINFLIHDSTLFDGVDSRQRALSLESADRITRAIGAQYICALNSDNVPYSDFDPGFDFKEHVRLTLTDKTPSESLLGFRFERPSKSGLPTKTQRRKGRTE